MFPRKLSRQADVVGSGMLAEIRVEQKQEKVEIQAERYQRLLRCRAQPLASCIDSNA